MNLRQRGVAKKSKNQEDLTSVSTAVTRDVKSEIIKEVVVTVCVAGHRGRLTTPERDTSGAFWQWGLIPRLGGTFAEMHQPSFCQQGGISSAKALSLPEISPLGFFRSWKATTLLSCELKVHKHVPKKPKKQNFLSKKNGQNRFVKNILFIYF